MYLLKRLHYILEVFLMSKNGLGLLALVVGTLLIGINTQTVLAADAQASTSTASISQKVDLESQQTSKESSVINEKTGQVIVHYVDESGQVIAPAKTYSDRIGYPFTMQPIDIEGYMYSHYSGNIPAGSMKQQLQEFTFVYQKKTADSQRNVVIQFVDESGHQLKANRVQVGQLNEKYSVVPDQIAGYTLLDEQNELNGIYQNYYNILTLVYRKTVDQGSLTTQYVDQNGQAIIESTITSGEVGSAYAVTAKQINGYQVTGQKVINGQYRNGQQTIQFVYQKIAKQVTTVTPNNNQIVKTATSDAKLTSDKQVPTKTAKLPQTGLTSNDKLVGIGLTVSMFGLLGFIVKRF